MAIKSLAILSSKMMAPLTVGAAGSGTGVWWLLFQEKSELEGKLEKVNEVYTNIGKENQDLFDTGERINKYLEELRAKQEDAQSQIEQLEKRQKSLEKEKNTLSNEREQEKNNLMDKVWSNKGKVTSWKARIEELIQKISSQKSNLEQARTSLNKEKSQLDQSSQTLRSQTQEIQQKEQKLEKLKKEIASQNIQLMSNYRKFLSDEAPHYDFSKPINFKKIKIVSFEEKSSKLKIKDKNGVETEIEIKRKAGEFKKLEDELKVFKTQGFKYEIYDPYFQKWNKKIGLNFYEQDLSNYWGNKKEHSWKSRFVQELDLSKIFKEAYLKDVARIIMAIEFISNFRIKENQDNSLEFSFTQKARNSNHEFIGGWESKPVDQIQWNFFSYMFDNVEDFTRYLIIKNYEYQTTKTLDLGDLLSPAMKSESYKQPLS